MSGIRNPSAHEQEQQRAARAVAVSLAGLGAVKRVILFGSRARGDAAERADIDLAVDIAGATHREWQRVLDVVDAAETLLKIDCVRLDGLQDDDPLGRAIERDGVVLLDRQQTP